MTKGQSDKEGAGKGGKRERQRPYGIARTSRVARLIDKHRELGTLHKVPVLLGSKNTAHHAGLLQAHGVQVPENTTLS